MSQVRVLVLRSPGTNCDEETAFAFEMAGAQTERIHVNRVLETPAILDRFQILCVPGGFSYGDDLAAGRILGSLLRFKLGDSLASFRDSGRLILGICNGFQVLMKTGLLIENDPATGHPQATLAFNRQGRYEDRWVHIRMNPGKCAFVRRDEVLTMPIAHAEGNFIVSDPSFLATLKGAGRVNATYVDQDGKPGPFPINPNGSMGDVAGVCDATGRVFAMMPHPERHLLAIQHPRWTRRADKPKASDPGDGLAIFRNGVDYFR
ncbi:MAG: phosphoribosylformylglycinamidine synthase I [Planctomycetota bacterium]